MDLKFNRKTRFPSNEPGPKTKTFDSEKDSNPNRRTRFPGGTETEEIRLLKKEEQETQLSSNKEPLDQLSFRLPIRINPRGVVLENPVPKKRLLGPL